MNAEEEQKQIEALLARLGASEAQAQLMAKQLMKRADQWVEDRGMSRVEAMQTLLEMVIAGRSGETPPQFKGVSKDEEN